MKGKLIENVLYGSVALCLIAQIVIGKNYILGQGLYLIANIIGVVRTFSMKRPIADKIKDTCFLAVTIGLIGLYLLHR